MPAGFLSEDPSGNEYGEAFFKRKGNYIFDFEDNKGYIQRWDAQNDEYGILTPDRKVQTVFKIQPKPGSGYKNGYEYLKKN